MRGSITLLVAALLLVAGGAFADVSGPDAFERLEGRWSNAAQVQRLPADVARRASPGRPWLDSQYARFVRFPAPQLGELVYYMEWRAGGPEGEITRQRIWAFRHRGTAAPTMRFYVTERPDLWAASAADPALLATLAKDRLPEYPPGCEVVFARRGGGWEGAIPPEACVIVARQSQRRMTIAARVTLDGDRWHYDEAGTLDDGTKAFVVPEGHRYVFLRVP
jgi:hypothetical protein